LVCNPDWNGDLEQFYANLNQGFPYEWCEVLLNSLSKSGIKIIYITARNEKCKNITKRQLNSWFDFSYLLYMRGRDDLREDYVIKEEYLLELKSKYDILFCLDDNPDNCRMFRRYIPTLMVC
jgi:hypothetical protein